MSEEKHFCKKGSIRRLLLCQSGASRSRVYGLIYFFTALDYFFWQVSWSFEVAVEVVSTNESHIFLIIQTFIWAKEQSFNIPLKKDW